MAKVSFSKPNASAPPAHTAQKPVVDVQATVTPPFAPQVTGQVTGQVATALTQPDNPPPQTNAVATRPANCAVTPFDDNEAAIDIKDIVLPRLNLAYDVGDLGKSFTPGALVLDQKLQLLTPDRPKKGEVPDPKHESLEIVMLGFTPGARYVERVPGGSERGNIVDSPAEVVQCGGTIDYNEHKATQKPMYQKMVTGVILIKKPASVTDLTLFPLNFKGADYCIALWSMKGTVYTRAAKKFYTARSNFGHLKEGYAFGTWKLDTGCELINGNWTQVPVLTRGEPTTPEFRDFAHSLFS